MQVAKIRVRVIQVVQLSERTVMDNTSRSVSYHGELAVDEVLIQEFIPVCQLCTVGH